MMKSRGLSTEPWWTPTFTSNFTVPLTNTDNSPRIGIHPLHQSHNLLLHTQVFSAPTRWPSEALDQMPSPGLRKPCRVSCWQPTIWWSHPQSSPGLSWPALSAWDCGSFPFQCISLTLVEADNETLLPVRGYLATWQMIAAARSRIMEAPVSPAAHTISTTVPDGPGAWPTFIWETACLTISMVIWMGGPSTDHSSDRWSGSQSNSTLRSLW